MISKKAISNYLNRPPVDHTWLKRVKATRLSIEILYVIKGTGFRFITKPYHHQLVSFYIGCFYPRFLFYIDMGLGKTKIALDCFRYHHKTGKCSKLLVLVPNIINIEGWCDEVGIHTKLKSYPIVGSTNDKWERLGEVDAAEAPLVAVVSYDGMMDMVCNTLAAGGKGDAKKMVINKDKIEVFSNVFDAVCFDEAHNVKNRDTLTFKICEHVTQSYIVKYALTGTPLGRNPIDLWAPYYLVDNGETLGTFGMFREVFFTNKLNKSGFPEWVFQNKLTGKLRKLIKHKSIRYRDRECGDVPPHISYKKLITLSEQGIDYYRMYAAQGHKAKEDKSDAKLEACFIKLRQIASGFITLDLEQGTIASKKKEIIDIDYSKIQILKDLITSMSEGSKMLVFHEFIESGKRIIALLKELNIKHAIASSLVVGSKAKLANVTSFKNDPDCRVFVVNSKAGAEGGNFQMAKYLVYYESPVSPIVRTQSFKRVVRGEKKERTYVYDLVARGTVDERVLEFLDEGKDIFEQLIDSDDNMINVIDYRHSSGVM